MVGEGLAPPVLPEFLLRRIFARPAPGEQAPRFSGGECEPDSARLWRTKLDQTKRVAPPERSNPIGLLNFLGVS